VASESVVGAATRSIERQRVVQMKTRGGMRTVEIHRIWRRPDGTLMAEVFQRSGFSRWTNMPQKPPMGKPPMRKGAIGWRNIPLDDVLGIADGGANFSPRPDYNPYPRRSYGRVVAQLTPVRGARRDVREQTYFPYGFRIGYPVRPEPLR